MRDRLLKACRKLHLEFVYFLKHCLYRFKPMWLIDTPARFFSDICACQLWDEQAQITQLLKTQIIQRKVRMTFGLVLITSKAVWFSTSSSSSFGVPLFHLYLNQNRHLDSTVNECSNKTESNIVWAAMHTDLKLNKINIYQNGWGMRGWCIRHSRAAGRSELKGL